MSAGEYAYVAARVTLVGRVEFGYVEREVLFRRVDVVGFAVVIDKYGHVARHLSALVVALVEHSLVYGFIPLGCPPLELYAVPVAGAVGFTVIKV